MTSISSGIEPQNGDATEHSCGGLLKLTGRAALPTPTMVRWPRTRATCAAIVSVGLTPTRSRTSSAPWPSVMSLMRLTASSPEISASSAPNVLAISSLSAEVSTATTVVAAAERLEHLDGHLAQASCADHHRGRTRPQQVQRALHGVVAGQPGVGERGRLARIQVAQRDQVARRRDEQIFGHAAVGAAEPARARASRASGSSSPSPGGSSCTARSPMGRTR